MDLEAKKKLGEVVKKARGDMSQRAFAKLLGVSYTAIQTWEKGETVPDIERMAEIAARADYKMGELLDYLGVKAASEPSDLNVILRQINQMPLSQVTQIVQAGVNRLAAAAESLEHEAKVS